VLVLMNDIEFLVFLPGITSSAAAASRRVLAVRPICITYFEAARHEYLALRTCV
jgi:hypothetical protein